MALICSNRKCSPLFPFTGTALVRRSSKDIIYNLDGTVYETTMYYGICKGHYLYEGDEPLPLECPKCHTNRKWGTANTWRMVCPKCGI